MVVYSLTINPIFSVYLQNCSSLLTTDSTIHYGEKMHIWQGERGERNLRGWLRMLFTVFVFTVLHLASALCAKMVFRIV